MENQRYVFPFEQADGGDKKLFGGKGAGLAEMTHMGLPVPPGFVITIEACRAYYKSNKKLPGGLMEAVCAGIRQVEAKTGKGFGDVQNPLLFSVRSGAALSMPGMMDTVLNLGLNGKTIEGLIRQTGDERFAYDAYRRFIQLFGKIALGVEEGAFDAILNDIKGKSCVTLDIDLAAEGLKDICDYYLALIEHATGAPLPEDPLTQLKLAIEAVFRSWMGKRAIDYRRQFRITPEQADGTAVNICTMVFGNRGADSATGVAFTRDPRDGRKYPLR
jgi:pyruvate,orthophosphate dikinase